MSIKPNLHIAAMVAWQKYIGLRSYSICLTRSTSYESHNFLFRGIFFDIPSPPKKNTTLSWSSCVCGPHKPRGPWPFGPHLVLHHPICISMPHPWSPWWATTGPPGKTGPSTGKCLFKNDQVGVCICIYIVYYILYIIYIILYIIYYILYIIYYIILYIIYIILYIIYYMLYYILYYILYIIYYIIYYMLYIIYYI